MAALALLLGIILVGGAFVTDTAPAGTHNLGLLQQQMMTLHCGLALLIVAAIRWERPHELRSGRATPPHTEAEPAARMRYERPTGFDTQQKVIGGVLVVALASMLYLMSR